MKNNCHCQEDWYEPEKCKNGTCEFFHCDNCEKKSKNMAKEGFQEAFFCGGLNGCQHMLGRSSEKDNSIEQRLEKLSKSDQGNLKKWMEIIDDLLQAQEKQVRKEERKRAVKIIKGHVQEVDMHYHGAEYHLNPQVYAEILNSTNDAK